MNNEKLKKIEVEIVKLKSKITDYTARLRELERQKTELENACLISLVRDMDILPDELTVFIQAFKKPNNVAILPEQAEAKKILNNTEVLNEEK